MTPPITLPVIGEARFRGIGFSHWKSVRIGVLWTGVATGRIRSGQQISVDGDKGMMTKQQESSHE